MSPILSEISSSILLTPLFSDLQNHQLETIPITKESEELITLLKTAREAVTLFANSSARTAIKQMRDISATLSAILEKTNSIEIYPLFERIEIGLDQLTDLAKECHETLRTKILSISFLNGASVEKEVGELVFRVSFIDHLNLKSPSPTLRFSSSTSPLTPPQSPSGIKKFL